MQLLVKIVSVVLIAIIVSDCGRGLGVNLVGQKVVDLKQKATDVKDSIKDTAVDAKNVVKNTTIDAAVSVKNTTVDAAETVKNSTIDAAETVKNTTIDAAVSVKETAKDVAEKAVDVANYISDLGGNLKDIITETASKLPQIATDGLWVFDEENKLSRLSLEIPPILELGSDVSDKVFFSLHTNKNAASRKGVPMEYGDVQGLRKLDFNPSRETIIVAHGWKNSNQSAVCQNIKDAYLSVGDYNVILVDWRQIAGSLYVYASNLVTKVGKHVAKMVDFLGTQGMKMEKTRLIGHSLGAHVVGLAGYYAARKPLYVVGCDPALPLFYTASPKARISNESAQNVEIIHSNAGLLGVINPLGHVDFYPNGGSNQNGCGVNGACSHSRSHEYYAESVNGTRKFLANKCKSHLKLVVEECDGPLEVMGAIKNRLTSRGAYFLTTNEEGPFAKGRNGTNDVKTS